MPLIHRLNGCRSPAIICESVATKNVHHTKIHSKSPEWVIYFRLRSPEFYILNL